MQLIEFLVLVLVTFGVPSGASAQTRDPEKLINTQPHVQSLTTNFLTRHLSWILSRRNNKNAPPEELQIVIEKTFDSEVERLAKKYNQDPSLARAIIKCESLQYGSKAENKNYIKEWNEELGTTTMVYWSSDWGWFQVNDYYHREDAKKAGYDFINNKWDNLEYGFILLSKQGRAPWKASSACTDRELKLTRVVSTTTQSS
jgi:hypothetical protein